MNKPTDAELDALWRFEASKNWDSTLAMRTSFTRAALAKWGTPAPVGVEPVAWYEYNADLDAWFLAYGHNPKAKTRPLVFGDAAPQQQPRLTDEEIEDFADASTGYSRMVDIKYFARAIEKKVRGEA